MNLEFTAKTALDHLNNYFFFFTRNPLKVWASGTAPKWQIPDAYTPPLSKHRVNREMPQLGVKLETSRIIVCPDTLPYRWC